MISEIFHRRWGEGEAIVVIHGLFGSMENLGMITRLLKDDYAVYGIDLPNHGRSQHVETTAIASMAASVVDWMDEVGLSNAHFLGHSLGGKVSMEIALRYPDRVNKLVVADIAPVTYGRRHDDVFAAFRAVDLNCIEHRTDAYHVMEAYVADIPTRSFLLKNLHKVDGHWQWRIHLEALERDYPEFIRGNTTECPAFERPVLFVKGENSSYILPEHRDQVLELFPQASIKIIHNTEHWLHAEKPDIFTGMVKRFLA
jgi:esterase